MLTEKSAADANAHSKGIDQGIIQHCRDCKKRPIHPVKRPDKMAVEREVDAEEEQNRQDENPTLQQNTKKNQHDIDKTGEDIKLELP